MARNRVPDREETEDLPLSKAVEFLLEECRMVLPGIQALFGFQLIAVFNNGFSEKLTEADQHLHLAAVALIAVAVALIMTPAAYHRQEGPRQATARFVRISTRLLLWSMLPLATGVCLDFYLVARIVFHDGTLPALGATGLFAVFVILWVLLPRVKSLQRLAGG